MRPDSPTGRTLWPVLLVLLLGYVVADFVHYPFVAPTGSAAVPVPQVTLWVAGGDAGGDAATVARDAAAAFELRRRSTAVETLAGSSTQAVADFLAGPRRRGVHLLVVTNATLADLARDRLARLVPGAGVQAALARQLLRAAAPIGVLSSDPLELGVPRRSPIRDARRLLDAMRAAPAARLFALPDDTWTRARLAALVDAAGVPGRTRFSVYPSGREAVQAMDRGEAGAVLTTRSALRPAVRAGRARALAWPPAPGAAVAHAVAPDAGASRAVAPDAGAPRAAAPHAAAPDAGAPRAVAPRAAAAPRAWVALVAPPWLPAADVERMRALVRALAHDRRWRRALAREGRAAAPALGGGRLDRFVARHAGAADRLQRLARVVEAR